MLDDNVGNRIPPTETLMSWVEAYDITHPVTNDTSGSDAAAYVSVGYPTYVLIDRDMTIVSPDMYPVDENLLRALLAEDE